MKTIFFLFILSAFVIDSLTIFRLTRIPGLSLKNISLYACFIILFFTEISSGRIWLKRIPGFAIFALFCLFVLIQILYLHLTGGNIRPLLFDLMYVKWGVVDLFLIYILAFWLVDDIKTAQLFLILMIVCFAFLNLLSVISSSLGLQIFHIANMDAVNLENRFVGSFGNPNQTSYFLCNMIPYMYYFIKVGSSKPAKLLLLLSIIGSLCAVLLSGSRGGLLCLLFLAVTAFFVLKEYKAVLASGAFVLAVILVILATGTGRTYLQNTFTRTETIFAGDLNKGSSGRLKTWRGYLDAFLSSPGNIAFGIGYGNSKQLMAAKARELGWVPATHNYYLEILVDLGMTGLLFHLFFFISVYRYIGREDSGETAFFKKVILISIANLFVGWCFTSMHVVLKFLALMHGLAINLLWHSREREST